MKNKLKVALASDLHLEFGSLTLENSSDVDILILSGDILVESDLDPWNPNLGEPEYATNSFTFHKFFQECSKNFPHVVYVAGNHEHYGGDLKYTVANLKVKLAYLKNVHVLERDTFRYDDFIFVGSTLWTNMNKSDPLTLYHIKSAMKDFSMIKNSDKVFHRKVPLYKKDEDGNYIKDSLGNCIKERLTIREEITNFSPQDAIDEHNKTLQYIDTVYNSMQPWETMIVVSHHTPSKNSTEPRYISDHLLTGGYSSDLSEFILDRPSIRLWTHGHTHGAFDYMIGDCRVVCNPCGYKRVNSFELKVIEI